MKSTLSLSAELMDVTFLLTEIIKTEFKMGAAIEAPTITQFKVLWAIKDGAKQVGKISEAFGISQPAASKIVDHLVNDGWLIRSPHPNDRRQIELQLTPKASSCMKRMMKRSEEKINQKLSHLTVMKKNSLAKGIHTLKEVLSHEDFGETR